MKRSLLFVVAALLTACSPSPAHKFGATYGTNYLASVTTSSPLSGSGTASSPLAISAATANAAGSLAAADFMKLATVPNTSGFGVQIYKSAEIDLQTPASGIVIAPAGGPGLYTILYHVEPFLTAGSGTATGPLVGRFNQTATDANVLATAQINSAIGVGLPSRPGPLLSYGQSTATTAITANTPLTLNITTGVTGTTGLKGVFIATVGYTAIP